MQKLVYMDYELPVIQDEQLCKIGQHLAMYSMVVFLDHIEWCEECKVNTIKQKED